MVAEVFVFRRVAVEKRSAVMPRTVSVSTLTCGGQTLPLRHPRREPFVLRPWQLLDHPLDFLDGAHAGTVLSNVGGCKPDQTADPGFRGRFRSPCTLSMVALAILFDDRQAVIAFAHLQDRARGSVRIVSLREGTVLDGGPAGELHRHQDMPFAAVEDHSRVFLGAAGITDASLGSDEWSTTLPHSREVDRSTAGGRSVPRRPRPAGGADAEDCAAHGQSVVRSTVIRSTAWRLSGAGCNFAAAQSSMVRAR